MGSSSANNKAETISAAAAMCSLQVLAGLLAGASIGDGKGGRLMLTDLPRVTDRLDELELFIKQSPRPTSDMGRVKTLFRPWAES